jgi:hypothetical protein
MGNKKHYRRGLVVLFEINIQYRRLARLALQLGFHEEILSRYNSTSEAIEKTVTDKIF